jgi:hypothetical protein
VKVGALWHFEIDEIPEATRAEKPDEFQVIHPSEPFAVLDLRRWADEMEPPPPMTALGQQVFDATKPLQGPRAVPIAQTNDPLVTCNPQRFPRSALFETRGLPSSMCHAPFAITRVPDELESHAPSHLCSESHRGDTDVFTRMTGSRSSSNASPR